MLVRAETELFMPPHPFARLHPAHYCATAVDPPSHSRKPDEFYARAERYCDGPYVDRFAREHPLRGRPISEQRSGKLRYAGAVNLDTVVDLLSPDS